MCDMLRKIQLMLCVTVSAVICSCERPSVQDQEPPFSGVGTCAPITVHDEFIFLSWYELININAESKLEEFRNPSAEWRLRMLKDAGFNTYFDYRLSSLEEAEALLDLGDRVGMKIITECAELHDSTTTMMAVEALSVHPSFYAYDVWDEPDVSKFPEVRRRIKEIYKYDKEHPCYVNLLPNYAWDEWVEETYLETVRYYLKTVPVSFLSFDFYPVIVNEEGSRTLREAWYHNLEDIRTAALEAKVPIWSFALVKAHAVYPKPTLADLRVQHFSNLVYGAVAFQYFTARAIVWRDAVTEFYPLVKQVNHELKQMEKTLNGKKELQRQVLAYSKTRPVRDGLKQQKNAKAKAAYRQKYESDFIIADAAARYFRENGISKLPSYKALQAEIETLIQEKNSGYNDYRAKREEYRRLQTVKGNIDQILHRERKPVKRQEQER